MLRFSYVKLAVLFGQVLSLLACEQTRKRRPNLQPFESIASNRDAALATLQATIEWSTTWPVTLRRLEIFLNGLASVGALQKTKGGHYQAPN